MAQGYLKPRRCIRISSAAPPEDTPESEADEVARQPVPEIAALPVAIEPGRLYMPAPAFALEVIGGTRQVQLSDFAGRPVVLLFNWAKTAEAADAVNLRLRSRQPDHRMLPIVTVVEICTASPSRSTA